MAKMNVRMLAGAVIGASAVAAALAFVGRNHSPSEAPGKEKCFGVVLAGENACASAGGEHNCGGQSTIDYSGHEWMLVASGTCAKMGGKLEAFDGVGAPPSADGKSTQG